MDNRYPIENIADIENNLVKSIGELIDNAKSITYRAINTTMVCTYFEIGRIIVETFQDGKERAEYGTSVLKNVAKKLSKKYGKGYSETNLKQMRVFFVAYSDIIQKSQKLSDFFKLSWSHYLFLSRIGNISERSFYEIEAINNNFASKYLTILPNKDDFAKSLSN